MSHPSVERLDLARDGLVLHVSGEARDVEAAIRRLMKMALWPNGRPDG